jgi:AraC-like DNA-binding protein
MHTFNVETLCKSDDAEAMLIKTTYAGPYADRDFTPFDSVSFPLNSCYGYRASGEMLLADDNVVLFDRRQTEFSVQKFKTFHSDTTLSIGLADAQEFLDAFMRKDDRAAVFRRTPGVETLLRRFLLASTRADAFFRDQCLADLINAAFEHPAAVKPNKNLPNTFQKRPVALAKDFIHANSGETLSLDAIAGAAYISPFHFSRLFRRATGYSPYAYHLLTRLERAKILLLSGTPVGQAAFETGFNSLENFSLAFKKVNGCAPAHFQKRKIY